MRRVLLAAWVMGCGCAAGIPDDDPLRPRPIPEDLEVPKLDEAKLRFTRTDAGLRIEGEPGALSQGRIAASVAIAEVRASSAVLEIPAASDASFVAELEGALAETTLALTPLAGASLGATVFVRVDALGNAAPFAPSLCLTSSGLWDLGSVADEGAVFERTLEFTNLCSSTIDLRGARLRSAQRFRLLSDAPLLAPGAPLSLTIRFELGADAAADVWTDMLDFPAAPDETGVALRVRR